MRQLIIASIPLLLITACDDSGSKKPPGADGGAAGSNAGAGGSASGAGGSATSGGAGNATSGGAGGAGGMSGGSAGMSGSAGQTGGTGGSQPSHIISVAPGAQGLSGTAVEAQQANPASQLYGTQEIGDDADHSGAPGTNGLYYTNVNLGLLPADDLDAVSAAHDTVFPEPLYFSVRNVTAQADGLPTTEVRDESGASEDPGDVFVSIGALDATGSGKNQLYSDEYRMGLQPLAAGGSPKDNVNAFDLDVTQNSRLYFSVTRSSQGAPGSAVAKVAANERGCTLFESDGDGVNRVTFTCDQLGLLPGDDIDALIAFVVANNTPDDVWFSVDAASVGKSGSAVFLQSSAAEHPADVFASLGGGDNTLLIDEASLGLQPLGSGAGQDDIDALAVRGNDFDFFWYFGSLTPPPPPPGAPPPTQFTSGPKRHSCDFADPRDKTPAPAQDIRGVRAQLEAPDVARLFNSPNAPFGPALSLPGIPYGTYHGGQATPGSIAAGQYLHVSIKLRGPFPDDDPGNKFFQYAFVLDRDGLGTNNFTASAPCDADFFDGTDRWYELHTGGDGTLTLTVTDAINGTFTDVTPSSGTIAIVDVDEIHFFIPKSELDAMGADLSKLSYRVSAFAHDGDYVTNWSGGVFPGLSEPALKLPL